jgi:hypothetical protein
LRSWSVCVSLLMDGDAFTWRVRVDTVRVGEGESVYGDRRCEIAMVVVRRQ